MGYLNDLAAECHRTAEQHGFWDHLYVVGGAAEPMPYQNKSIWAEKIALMHSEASEMLECLRKNKDEEALALECADLLIRLLDFTDARLIDIDGAVAMKMAINNNRERLHGGNF